MSRFGALTAKFYAPSDLSTPLNVGGVTTKQPVSGVTDDYRDGEGASSLTFINDTALNTLAAVGNICWSYKTDSVRDDLGANGVTFTEPFIIRSRVAGPAQDELTISGPDLLTELKRFTVFRPLGDETITNTTLAAQGDAPITGRTLAAGAPGGVDNVIPSASTAADEGKEITIALDDGGTHVTVIMSIQDVGGTDHYILRDRMPSNAATGKAITLKTRQLRVTAPETFQQGVEVVVTLNSGTHTTLIAESPTDTNLITLRDALPSLANNGNAIQSKDYSGKSTTDVTDVVTGFASGWSLSFEAGTGTADGTRYAGGGDTVYDILRSISDETGEIFRLRSAEAAPMGPKRTIVWRRTHDAAGVAGTVRLVMPTQANMASETANKNRAIMLERPRHAGEYDPVTQVIPIAGDARVTLHACSATALSAAAGLGFDVVYPTSLYASPYVENTALTASIGVHQRRVVYSEVSVEGDNSGSIQEAADKLLKLSISYLRSHVTTAKEIEAVCVSPIGIRPAQKVELYFVSPTGEYTIDYTTNPLYVQAVRREVSNRGDMPGVPITILSLSPDPTRPPSHSGVRPAPIYTDQPRPGDTSGPRLSVGGPGREIGKRLKNIERMAANMGTPMLVSLAVGGGGGGGGGGVTDHGMLTGLADNDHTQYVNAATNTSLALSGQGLAVNLKTDPGLVISSGLGMGTPSTLTAATSNAVSGSNHSHAITATDNAKSTVSTILKGTANGDLTLRYLTADKVVSPELETASGDITLDPASGKTINDGNLEFTGARSVTTSSGSLTLAPVSDLIFDPASDATKMAASSSLQTANWSSGFLGTGWGVTYAGAADFRSIYADELHVAAFIADTARVKVGSEYITPSMAIISRTFTIPAVSGTGTLYVEDAPGLDDTAIFADNDWILLRIIDRPAGGLNVLNVWGQVSGYSNLTDGEQSWTFTTRSAGAAAVGEAARRGGVALDFGKSGDGWLWLTSIDPAGSPYLGITTWQGSDPYTEGNRSHKLRLGQLKGTSGMHEWGLQAGQNTSNFIRFSDLRSEIHGSRLSLYAGDGGQLRVTAARVIHYRAAGSSSNLTPNADHTTQGVLSTGATFYTEVDEAPSSPTTTDYIYNGTNQSGVAFLGLGNPTWTGITYQCNIQCHIVVAGITNDTITLYGQVFDADETTPLTSEILIHTASANTAGTTPNVQCATVVTDASQTRWNAARLRLRWEYTINASEEAIRLDPNVPSIAVGNPLPTGTSAGGPGLWAGLESGAYKFKMGGTSGTGARVEWDGTDLILRAYDGTSMIRFDSDGSSYFAGAMTLGTSGGIYQGTGTFASPTAGIKVWNSGGDGRYSTFSGGGEKVRVNKDGVQLLADTVGFTRPSSVTWSDSIGGTAFASISANSTNTDTDASRPDSSKSSLVFIKNGSNARTILAGGTAYFTLDSAASYALLQNVDLYVKEKGVAIGYTATPSLNRGQIASDFAGEHDFNALVLQDTTDIAHGMTTIVGTATYGALGKNSTTGGGLKAIGASESTVAIHLDGYITSGDGTTSTSAVGGVTTTASLKDGTGATSTSTSTNIFVARNYTAAQFIIKGNGDFHYNGTGAAYDSHDDVGLLRTLSRTAWQGAIESEWDRFVTTNRQHLIDAGILSEGGFINGAALNRLLTGAIWQLNERLSKLEGQSG